jgi:hypothetical protein
MTARIAPERLAQNILPPRPGVQCSPGASSLSRATMLSPAPHGWRYDVHNSQTPMPISGSNRAVANYVSHVLTLVQQISSGVSAQAAT